MSPAANTIDTKFYRKSFQGQHRTVDLDPDTAKVFAVIDENTQVSRMAQLADVSAAAVWKAIAKLTRLGLIEDADNDFGFMVKTFTDTLHAELTKAVGPISIILLKKVSEQMDISFPHIPVEMALEFVYQLAEQIPDERASTEFQQTILKKI
jgi:biotin operon repressor